LVRAAALRLGQIKLYMLTTAQHLALTSD
jgi:hypothetical protein